MRAMAEPIADCHRVSHQFSEARISPADSTLTPSPDLDKEKIFSTCRQNHFYLQVENILFAGRIIFDYRVQGKHIIK